MSLDIPVVKKSPLSTVLLRPLEWADRIGSDTILSSSWTAYESDGVTETDDLTVVTDAIVGTTTVVKVSGGVLDATYVLTNVVVTSSPDNETIPQSYYVVMTLL